MRSLRHHWRPWLGCALFIAAELILFGASEGAQKWQWIEAGTVPNVLLTLGFVIHRRPAETARTGARGTAEGS